MKTFASVTEAIYTCGFLERRANDPDSPIEFDATVREFLYVVRSDDGDVKNKLSIYHCPFCGGETPQSKRDTLFAVVSHSEEERIRELFDGLKSVTEVIQRHGPPEIDRINAVVSRTPERGAQPPVSSAYRYLVYSNLSDYADVHVVEYPDRVGLSMMGKYTGPRVDDRGPKKLMRDQT
jgi:hypothetical protein